jgi:N-acetylneuraminic acid mutarotase
MKIKISLFGLFLIFSCNKAHSHLEVEQNYANYPWQFTNPMPHGRYGHDAVYAANGKIYVMGGQVFLVAKRFEKDKEYDSWLIKKFNNGWYSNLAYDPQKDKWEYVSLIPGWRKSDIISIFDPNKEFWRDQWREYRGFLDNYTEEELRKLCQPSVPNGKPLRVYDTDLDRFGNGLSLSISNNNIFWMGGQNFGGNVENIALPYDPKKDKWPNKIMRSLGSSSKAHRKYYWEVDQRESYDTRIPPMLEPRCDHQSIATSTGKIYVMGGWREETAINKWGSTYNTEKNIVSKTMECYDPKTNKWEYKKPLNRERMVFAAVTGKDDKIYVFGGAAGMSDDPNTPILDTVEVYNPGTDSWSSRKPMPTPRFDHAAVLAADGKIYVMGGAEVYDKISSAVFIYDPATDSWEQGPDMILPRATLAAVATPDGKIYAIGGTDVGAYKNSSHWKHLSSLVSKDELRGYEGKVQDSVEVLDIFKWKKSMGGEKKKNE